VVDQVLVLSWIVFYGGDIGLAKCEASDVQVEIDEFLQCHAVGGGAVVRF